ncbi:T6SS phospholipase effector Tle1-like catalytic domain-containing protein [Paraburkholderia caffeinilytica]|uniref:T6SS phospholipase effector Tle1-like catalytic domain-containing protein n=1 Tax=Paraburkholderia caffeinilytica TaxID=1761016 RepID=UPI003DA0B03F
MSMNWPEPMPEAGRLPDSAIAWLNGVSLMKASKILGSQTLSITLFFDGTNNNDDIDNPWRDSRNRTHTNVARLFNAAIPDPDQGMFPFYIPGVGTPFPEIGETLYTTHGKAFASGFNARCVWAYTRVLNAVYCAVASNKTQELISIDDAMRLCDSGANGDMTGFGDYVQRLSMAHQQTVNASAWARTVQQVWINVIGFSRGAAGARAFVHKLINRWAPSGNLGNETGKYSIPYQVNFVGLLDTVASVGLPDSIRATADVSMFAGHHAFASGGAMEIPDKVRFCWHAFSIHEQRMSFPLDSIRKGNAYPGDCRHEIAYPGVHSDVGGGYAPGAQGKGCGSDDQDDSHKLSQIPLHDMYIAALKSGVPLMNGDDIQKRADTAQDFALALKTVAAFNAWLKTVDTSVKRVEDAMKFGMGQLLSWRALRAQMDSRYIIHQPFFTTAPEDDTTPRKVAEALNKAKKTDPQLRELNAQLAQAQQKKSQAQSRTGSMGYPANMPDIMTYGSQIEAVTEAIRTRTEALCGEIAKKNGPVRPGEGAYEITTNDRTDLRQGAEEMRLLLGFLYPEKRDELEVREVVPANPSRNVYPPPLPLPPVLSVRREPPGSDSPLVTLAVGGITGHTVRTTILQAYNPNDDVLTEPRREVIPFLKEHTSPEAVAKLPREAVALFDDYVHDSRCGFRVPYFHEYAPGGYGWPRVIFIGGDTRSPMFGFDPLSVALDSPS